MRSMCGVCSSSTDGVCKCERVWSKCIGRCVQEKDGTDTDPVFHCFGVSLYRQLDVMDVYFVVLFVFLVVDLISDDDLIADLMQAY